MSAAITPFSIAVGDDVLADLRDRLVRTRWPEPEPVSDWSQGVNATAASSARLYWESFGPRRRRPVVTVPSGFAIYPKEIVPPVRAWLADEFPNIGHWKEMPRGGYFAAFEQPELFVADLREWFATLR